MNDRTFNLVYFFCLFVFFVSIANSSWESYLHYLSRKQVIEAIKATNPNWSIEQIQGLINSKQ